MTSSRSPVPAVREEGIDVGRDGELLVNGGHHRLAIAKALDLDALPIQIIRRHERWQGIREDVVTATEPADVISHLDVDLTHPDLAPLVEAELSVDNSR